LFAFNLALSLDRTFDPSHALDLRIVNPATALHVIKAVRIFVIRSVEIRTLGDIPVVVVVVVGVSIDIVSVPPIPAPVHPVVAWHPIPPLVTIAAVAPTVVAIAVSGIAVHIKRPD